MDSDNDDKDLKFDEYEEKENENRGKKLFSLSLPIINTFNVLKNAFNSTADVAKITALTQEFQINPQETTSSSFTNTNTINKNKHIENPLPSNFSTASDSRDASSKKYRSDEKDSNISTVKYKDFSSSAPSTPTTLPRTRPSELPSKHKDEELRHIQEYEEMRHSYEKKEAEKKALKEKKRLEREKRILENSIKWSKQILPDWDKMKHHPKTKELWWYGIPTHLRGKVWKLSIGNSLNITKEMYQNLVQQSRVAKQTPNSSHGSQSQTLSEIVIDVTRTFPMLSFFKKGGPQHQVLCDILEAYTFYCPEIGYVQGMSYIAAVLLLYLDEIEAFVCMCNLLNRECHHAFYQMNLSLIDRYYTAFHRLMKEFVPKVEFHLTTLGIRPEMYLLDWILTIFAKVLSLEIVSRIWDLYILEGDYFLFRVALGLMKFLKKRILDSNMETCLKLLTKHDEDIEEDELFACIQRVGLSSTKFEAVLALTALDKKNNNVNKV